MLNHVNTVLIGKEVKEVNGTLSSFKDGDIALFDENKLPIKAADIEKACAVYVGVVEGLGKVTKPDGIEQEMPLFRYSMPIQKDSKPHLVASKFKAASEDEIKIDFTSVTPEVGHRYVLRLVYNDIYEAPGQFTHTYETIAKSTTPADLVNAFVKKINKHKEARVSAKVETTNKLVLTAKPIPYNSGVTLDAGYSQVSVDAFMWKTIPEGLLSNVMYPIANLTISKTQGTPGKGNPFIVRDRENAALGYRGIAYRANGTYPYIAPEYRSDLSSEGYDTVTIEWDNKYLSNDNQYIKSTPLALELYVAKGKLKADANSLLDVLIKFCSITGKAETDIQASEAA